MASQAAIMGMGLVSAIGHDVETACASYRAGIARTASIGVTTVDPDTLEDIDVYGYPVGSLSAGFVGAGLYVRLVIAALNDLARNAQVDLHNGAFWHGTSLTICLSPTRESTDFTPDINLEVVRNTLCQHFSSAIPVEQVDFCVEANAGVVKQMLRATEGRSANPAILRYIVVGVDSLVGDDDIRFFQQSNRLHSDDVANGLIPGEAAAAILVEPVAEGQVIAGSKGYVSDIYCDKEDIPRFDVEVPEGHVTGRKLLSVLRQSLQGSENTRTCYVDLNGEEERAQAFGNAIPAIGTPEKPFPSNIQLPAEYFGDTGAASAAIAICLAVRSFERRYHGGGDVLVCSSSDTGEVASLIIRPTGAMGGNHV